MERRQHADEPIEGDVILPEAVYKEADPVTAIERSTPEKRGQSRWQSTIAALRCLVWVPAKRNRRLQTSFEQKAAKVSKAIVLRRR
jgi:hypothetical protein